MEVILFGVSKATKLHIPVDMKKFNNHKLNNFLKSTSIQQIRECSKVPPPKSLSKTFEGKELLTFLISASRLFR